MSKEELISIIKEEEAKGNVVVQNCDGLERINLQHLVNQPSDGILYDLNRDKATCMSLIDKVGWVNNYACALVIEYLKKKLEEYESEN